MRPQARGGGKTGILQAMPFGRVGSDSFHPAQMLPLREGSLSRSRALSLQVEQVDGEEGTHRCPQGCQAAVLPGMSGDFRNLKQNQEADRSLGWRPTVVNLDKRKSKEEKQCGVLRRAKY